MVGVMKRRIEIKLNKAKVFSKKYIFSRRFIVRNTLGLLLIGSITAGGIFSVKSLADYSEKQKLLAATSINSALESTDDEVVEQIAAESYEINAGATAVIDSNSIDTLRSHLADEESFDLAVGDTKKLTNSKYDMKGKFISIGKDANIHAKAEGQSEVVGILPEYASGKVLEQTEEWTKISSGDIQGYVRNECIVTDEEAAKKAEDAVVEIATVNVDNIGVREGADENAKVLFMAENGESFIVNEVDQYDWTELELVNGKKAYVSALYVDIEEGFKEAVAPDAAKELNDTIDIYTGVKKADEEEKKDEKSSEETSEKAEDTEKASEEKTADEDKEETAEPTEEKSEPEEKQEEVTEEKTEEVTEEATEEKTEEATTEEKTEEPTTEAPVVASDDVYLLAAIVYAEAGGESYEGQLAVANVVMNRLRNGYWGSTLSDVIYAPCQFTGCQTGAFSSALSTGGSSSCLQAAQAALAGDNNIGGCMYFLPTWNCDTSDLGSYTQIGNHIFW
jgi:Cell wall hydrolyses involved in spore germination